MKVVGSNGGCLGFHFSEASRSARLGKTQLLRKLFQLLPHIAHRSCSILGIVFGEKNSELCVGG